MNAPLSPKPVKPFIMLVAAPVAVGATTDDDDGDDDDLVQFIKFLT